jgi:hypothetical protein
VASQNDGDQGTEVGGGDASGADDRTGNDSGGPAAGFWVALAADCRTATSVDGITWQPQASYPATSRCSQVLWAGGLYLGTNQSASVAASAGLQDWNESVVLASGGSIRGIGWSVDRWLVTDTGKTVYSSLDGSAWTTSGDVDTAGNFTGDTPLANACVQAVARRP